jgi:hypothetical protein
LMWAVKSSSSKLLLSRISSCKDRLILETLHPYWPVCHTLNCFTNFCLGTSTFIRFPANPISRSRLLSSPVAFGKFLKS